MGLNALVYCNCIERGLLRTPHPYPDLLYIGESGCPEIKSSDQVQLVDHYTWQSGPPCTHEHMFAHFERLGNIAGIDFLRRVVTAICAGPDVPALPVLLDKVLYSGTHGGDCLSMDQVVLLQEELRSLKQLDFKPASISPDDEVYVDGFFDALQALINASLSMKKPISF